jgi:branched-chain amino acid transport system ATP-binding protein
MSDDLLSVEEIHSYYGDSHVLQGVSFSVTEGQVVALLGRNGAGKTTTIRTIMHMLPSRRGKIIFRDRSIENLATYEIARLGISVVQETRAIFPSLTVAENIELAVGSGNGVSGWNVARVFDRFPRLYERRRNGGHELSGGEQQMLAIARALVSNPRLLLLDEPSEGLAPIVVREIRLLIEELKADGLAMILVEQNLALATSVADYVYVFGKGVVRWHGKPAELQAAPSIAHSWLGIEAM